MALELSGGTERWRFDTGRDYTSTVPTVRDGVVYIDGSSSGRGPGNGDYLFALDGKDGTELWRAEIGLVQNCSPAATDDTVYVGSMNESVQALSVEDGTEQWSYETSGYVLSSPAVCGDIVGIGSHDNHVYGLNANTGDVRWQYDTGYQVRTAPAVLDGSVYIGSLELVALTG